MKRLERPGAGSAPRLGAIGPMTALALLAILNTLNIIDRKIVGILAEPMKHDLHLTDGQVGLLTGFAFSLVYAVCAVPIARVADRGNRARILAVSLAFWSLMTALSGMAQTFTRLLVARMGVAVGESACTPASYSLIADYFEPRRRGRAMALISVAVAIGTFIAFALGGRIAQSLDWRSAFFLVGLPGVGLALAIWFILPEPRGAEAVDAASATGADPNAAAAIGVLLRQPAYVLLVAGGCAVMFSLNALLIWTAPFLQRVFHWSLADAGLALGFTFGISGMISPLLSALIGDRLLLKDRGAYPWVMALLCLAAAPCLVAGLMAPSATAALVMIGLVYLLTSGWIALVVTPIRVLAGARRMALAVALLGVAHNLLGIGLGPLVVGLLSDVLQPAFKAEAIRYALMPAALGYLLAALALAMAARRIRASDVATEGPAAR